MKTVEVALDAHEKGIVAIPCGPLTKIPMFRWKLYQALMPPVETVRAWFPDEERNLAIITTGMVLFDVDDPTLVDMVLEHCGPTPHVVRTPRGGTHLGYRRRRGVEMRNQVDIRGHDIDVRTNGGIEVIMGRTRDGAYSLLNGLRPVAELPVAKVGWTRERKRTSRKVKTPSLVPETATGPIHKPEAYCLRIPSIQGQNGSKGLVRVVCVMRDAGRSPQQIFDFIMSVWNPQCAEPEWSEREVNHAIKRHCCNA